MSHASHHHHTLPDHAGASHCCADAQPDLTPLATSQPANAADLVQTPIRIQQMDCPTEANLLRQQLGHLDGVAKLDFNLLQRSLTVTHRPEVLSSILAALRKLGFTPELASDAATPAPRPNSQPWWPLALGAVAALSAEILHWLNAPSWLAAALAVGAIIGVGSNTYKKGWLAIRHANLNINALMSLAVTGALLIGQWPEAAMVMVLFGIAELIEAKSLQRARNAIAALMQLAPQRALVQQNDGSWQELDAKSVPIGAQVRVPPGARIALDGHLSSAHASINQAPITGESLPVDKSQGDEVFAGSINTSGAFDYQVSKLANDSLLARIAQAVQEAQGKEAPTQRLIDRFARIYTPVIFAGALLLAIAGPLLDGGNWLDWLYKALVLLVIACPCALVLSTPVTIVSALAAAARHGILIKGGVYLERGRKLAWLALDKTGTITQGRPEQTDFVALSSTDPSTLRRLAASLAQQSDHPVSRALSQAALNDAIKPHAVTDFRALPGLGSQGNIDGQTYQLGNHRLIHQQGHCCAELEARLEKLEQQGKSVVLLTDTKQVHALFAVADKVKQSSRQAIAELHALGLKTLMLSGDNTNTAQAIARQVGIDQAMGDLLPQDKLRAIEQLAAKGGAVGMVGDGINDTPALARAEIGFAMGAAGSDSAMEAADVALMDDDLRKLARFVRLSRYTHTLLLQNITLALGIKAAFVVLTLAGAANMWLAVFADVGASLLVLANGLRVLRR